METIWAQRLVIRITLICAGLLLLAPLTPRTSWVSGGGDARETGGTSSMYDAAGWDWLAPACGLVAIVGLLAVRGARSRIAGAVGSAVALTAFLVAMAAAGGHWLDGAQGRLAVGAFVTHPAPAALPFAIVALVGAGSALALLVLRLRTGGDGLHTGRIA